MRRLQQLLALTAAFLILSFSASYADDFAFTQMSPEVRDSLNSTKEPTLQQILDGLGYDIDVVNDRLPDEVWQVISGDYYEVMLAEVAGYSDQTASGWYVAGDPNDTTVIFTPDNVPGDTAFFQIVGCDSNGLFIAPFAGAKSCEYVYYTEHSLNPDHKDHAWVYCTKKRPNEFVIAWEDYYDLGDNDHNDLVLIYRMPNRPPVVEVPNDTSYFFCQPQTICFNVSASDPDLCGDTVTVSKVGGPGTFADGTCCFLPAAVDSAYTFMFVASDLAGGADTGIVVITVNVNQPPQLTCPDDGSVYAPQTFVSTDFSVTDPDGGSPAVAFLDITPSGSNTPTLVGNHVEWATTWYDQGDYVIRLVATDGCGSADTCQFTVTVVNEPTGDFSCPEDDSVHAGDTFVSTYFTLTYPECELSTVEFLDISPSATNNPTVVNDHVEWVTTCAENGDYVIRLITNDDCLVQDTCEFTVTVYNQSPEIVCPSDGDVQAGENFVSTNFSASDPDGDAVTVGLCGITPAPVNQPGLVANHVEWQTDCADAGQIFTVCLEVADVCGAKDTCYFDVTVSDAEPPMAQCPGDIDVEVDPGECTALVSFSIDATDNCPGVTVSANPPSGSTFPIGTTPVEVIAVDASGNADTCHFDVTVSDAEPPVAQCPGDIDVDNDAGECGAVVSFSIDATDNCSGVTVSANPPSGSFFPIGTTPVEVIAIDAAANADTCHFNVTVNDAEPPVAQCPGDITVGNDPGQCSAVVPFSIDATDNCAGVTVSANPASGSVFPIGTTPVEVIAVDVSGNADTCHFNVTVNDVESPVAQCPGDINVGVDPDECTAVVSFTIDATDNCPGVTVSANPPSGSAFPIGTTPVEVIATDASGNADTCHFGVTVSDAEPPVAQCPGDINVDNDAGECGAVVSFSIDATDNCSGVTVSANPPSGSFFTTGSTPVTVIAVDASGNADTCYFSVTVSDAEPPVAQCPGDITVGNDPGQCSAAVSFSVDATDNCSGVSVSANPPSGSVFPIGTTPVEVIATDVAGNADTCHFNVTVNDTESPVAQCPGDINVGVDPGECTALVSFTIDATDNCSGVTVSANPPSGSTFPVGTTPVEVIATDASGNADTCYFDVTVTNQPPDLTCPESDSAKCMEPFTSGDFSVYDPDNQSGVVVTLQSVSPSPENTPSIVGSHLEWTPTVSDMHNGPDFTFTLLATDPCGATDVCQFTVTVYNLPPIFTPPPDDSVHAGHYFVSQDFSVTDQKGPVTVGICGITPASAHAPTIVASHVELQTECDEAGIVFTICLEATDTCGAKDTGYFDVTVYNHPPELTCPADDSVHATVKFVSTDFSVVDPDGDPVTVAYLDISPAASYPPGLVDNHLEWLTTCAEDGDYFIRLVATDSCGLADTCGFTVRVYDNPPELTCPEDDSVHAGDTFVSTDFSVFDPDEDPPSVWYQGIDPGATNIPTIVDDHVEWVTTCAENGDYVITLMATAGCYPKDTCRFTVTVYNQPPDLVCPDDDSVNAGDVFISGDYSVTDPDDTSGVTVILHSVSPTPVNAPVLVDNHLEWATTCADLVNGPDFTFTLIAIDPCGAADTCEFVVTVYNLPPEMVCPEDDSVYAGDLFTSTDFSASDPKAEPVTITLCGIDPAPVHQPAIVASHVEWQTDCADAGNVFGICLEATDSCGAKDTCHFEVTVYNQPPIATCPDDGSVHAGESFISSDFSVVDEDPDNVVWDVRNGGPQPTNDPVIVDQHVEWSTACADDGDYLFLLIATDECGLSDTCEFTVNVYNQPPVLACPEDGDVHTGETFVSTDFSATDPDDGLPTVSFLDITPSATNHPTIVGSHVEWLTTCGESGNYAIRLVAADPCGAKDTCGFTVNVHNLPPQIACPSNGSVFAGATFASGNFTASDPDSDATTVTLTGINPSATYNPGIVGTHVEWVTTANESGNYTITLRVIDACGLWSECSFTVTVITPSHGDVSFIYFPEVDCVNPGEYVCLPILIDNNTTPFGGFDLQLQFDYTAMTLAGVEPGPAIEGFEYFTYRLLPCPLCGCCKYEILLYGQYDLPNGVENLGTPIPTTPPGVYQELARLCFVVNSDENLRGLTIPVCWEWEGTVQDGILVEDWDCQENTFSSWSGDTLFASSLLCEFSPSLCDDPGDRIQPLLVFQDSICGQNCGGVDVCAAGPDECKRGDVNYNYQAYEVADAVLFASYFVEGTSVFRYDMDYQICATDVNHDGRTLTLSDLVYLIRVILHDAVAIPKLAPSSEIASMIVTDGVVMAECASEIGALLFEFDGTVTPTLLADNMEMVANGSKVLVWSRNGQTIQNAEVMSYTGAQLVSVQAVDRDSRTLETVITARMTPTAFALHAAYPNPFNPSTNLSFTLPEAASYSMRIYNVAGQLVRSYQGMGSQGLNVITWDGRDNSGSEVSSGVYFYKLTAAGNSATEKMVMMK
jgi:hypothetical protein